MNHIRTLTLTCMLPIMLILGAASAHTAAAPQQASLYDRLGGYGAIAAVVDDLFPRLAGDKKLGRFWQHRGEDGIAREKQFLINFIVAKSGGPLYYKGREMQALHRGMRIDEQDWRILNRALKQTLDKFHVAAAEQRDVFAFIESTKSAIVEVR